MFLTHKKTRALHVRRQRKRIGGIIRVRSVVANGFDFPALQHTPSPHTDALCQHGSTTAQQQRG